MAPAKPYNGHKSWTYWNVSLWLTKEDQTAYQKCLYYKRNLVNIDKAAERMLQWLHDMDKYKTPDGAKYSKANIREVLKGL